MSYYEEADALLEVTAVFYYPGDKVNQAELENHVWTDAIDLYATDSAEEVIDDSSKVRRLSDDEKVEEAVKRRDRGNSGSFLDELREDHPYPDLEITAPCVAFDLSYIGEGRRDGRYGSGLEFEASEIGHEWFTDHTEHFIKEAYAQRARLEVKEAELIRRGKIKPEDAGPVRRLCWVELTGYYTSHDEYSGEHDAGVVSYGPVTLAEIRKMVKARRLGMEST